MKVLFKALTLVALIPLAGCGIIGQSESSCPGKPNGYVCKGPREVYELTNNKNSLFDGTQEGADDKKKQDASDDPTGEGAKVQIPKSGVVPRNSMGVVGFDDYSAPEPLAIRADARVLRIQFASFEDESGSLNMPGYAFVEVEPRRWLVGVAANKQPARIVPLSVRQEADSNLKAKESKAFTVDPLGVKHTIPTPGNVDFSPETLRK